MSSWVRECCEHLWPSTFTTNPIPNVSIVLDIHLVGTLMLKLHHDRHSQLYGINETLNKVFKVAEEGESRL